MKKKLLSKCLIRKELNIKCNYLIDKKKLVFIRNINCDGLELFMCVNQTSRCM